MVPVFPLFSTEGKHWLFLKNKLINKIPTLRALWKIDSCQISAMVKYIYCQNNVTVYISEVIINTYNHSKSIESFN